MLRWFSHATKDSGPSYALLKAVPSRRLPQELADREASPDFNQWADRIESDLDDQTPDEDAQLGDLPEDR